jgi:hypothetical protein
MSSTKPVGGRGKKAGYETKLIRVPLPVVPGVEKAIEEFRMGNGEQEILSYEEAIEAARKIMRSKKSASESLLKLLQVIYSTEIDKNELK